MKAQQEIGQITIAPEVLETVIRLATLAVPGVRHMITPPGVWRFLGRDGVKIEVDDNTVHTDVYIVIEPNANMLAVGRQIQAEVTRAIHDMIGMNVGSVDVHIEDVSRAVEAA